jgi:hypothetical protein
MNNHTPDYPGAGPDGRDPFEESLAGTWDSPDAAVDRRLRALIGPVTPLHVPPYGFERVALRARRRRHRKSLLTLAAGVTGVAVVAGGVLAGTQLGGHAVQTAGCDTVGRAVAAPAAWSDRGGPVNVNVPADVPVSGVDFGRGVMERKYEWAIGGVLTAAALSVGIVAGCSSSSAKSPSASATESGVPTPSQSVGTVQLPATTTAPAPSGSASPAAVPRCHTADLTPAAAIVAGSQGAGSESLNLELTNNSGHACTIYGFPGMKLEDMNSSGQATTVTRNFGVKPATITLANGASAATTVRFDFDMPVGGEPPTGNCEAPSVYLQITPPDETTQLSTTITGGPVTVCNHGTLDTLPFVAGVKGPNQ